MNHELHDSILTQPHFTFLKKAKLVDPGATVNFGKLDGFAVAALMSYFGQ